MHCPVAAARGFLRWAVALSLYLQLQTGCWSHAASMSLLLSRPAEAVTVLQRAGTCSLGPSESQLREPAACAFKT